MRIKPIYGHISGALLLALALAACGPAGTAGQAPTPAATAQPAATSVPAPTLAPTQPPAPTAEPTSAPTAAPAPTAQPTAAPASNLILATDVPWVYSAGTIFADDETFDFQQRGLPAPAYQLEAAPDGTYIAYVNQDGKLAVIDMRTGDQIEPKLNDIQIISFSFSPDSRSLALRVVDGPLQVLDLEDGALRTVREASPQGAPDGPRGILTPVAWTRDGLIVERILWASDAPPQSLALMDPASGSARLILEKDHLRAVVSPDGQQIAIVAGSLPIGETPTAAISILDVADGSETIVVPARQMFVKALRWSPDGTKLLYADSTGYPADTQVTTLHVINTDGSNEQVMEVGGKGVAPTFSDAEWLDNSTALLLSAEAGDLLRLYALPISSFDITGLRPLRGDPRPSNERQQDQIVYVPS